MKKNFLKTVFIIDESGSMQSSQSDVVGGFNGYIERQRKENTGKVVVSLYKFNNETSLVIANKPLNQINLLTNEDYTPYGFTALYDAIGQAVKETDFEISALPENERPNNIMAVIITDGQENASKEYTSQAIKTLISTHENLLKWNFVYLGVGLSDFTDADLLGLKYRASSQRSNLESRFDIIAEHNIQFCESMVAETNVSMNKLMKNLDE